MSDLTMRRNTRQREMIAEVLRHSRSHPTASDIYGAVKERLPKISLGTVYRNLDLLIDLGTVRKIEIPGSEARFDGNLTEHKHVRCVECGRIDDVFLEDPDFREDDIENLCGYRILGHRLEFVGLCPECLRKKEVEERETIEQTTGQ